MNWNLNFYILLFLSCFCSNALLDCGCNKPINRESQIVDFKEITPAENTNNGIKKICELQSQTQNKYYHDYYPADSTMALITGGDILVGTDEPHFRADFEAPERLVRLKDFYIDKYEVSNEMFAKFVKSSGYKTEAEHFDDSFLFKTLLTPEMQKKYEEFRVASAPWWYKVKGVSWQHPQGPESNLEGFWDHPVVHVSWNDATSYCKWAGKRLPTESEFEVACRGGKKRKLFPWGNKLMPKNEHWLNIWQGDFPDNNTALDGYLTTCPVYKFRQNDYDLYNIVGNVWEWVQDQWDVNEISKNSHRVKKGGSYLCHKSYCYRYRCAARSQNTADSSSGNLGFRCAKDL